MGRKFAQILKKVLCISFLLVLFSGSLALGSQQIERKHILVLFSFRPTLPVASQWDRGIRSVLESSTSHKRVVNIEYLDLIHYDDERYIQILLNNLRHKYSNPKPDLIIPVFNSAVALALNHGPDLFPGVPIVFGGIESKFVENRSLGPNVTGYLTDNNYTGTLDLALKLQPDTRNVVVVAGAGPIGRGWTKACREKFEAYKERVDFTYLIGLPLEALLEKLANLSAHTVVFSLPILQDGVGKKFIGNESLSHITRVSSAPVYSFRDVNIGTGIVGGYMSSFEEDGKAVGQLSLRILNGEQPEDIPITRTPTFLYMFDWRQLKRWSIAEERLPPGSIVLFEEFTLWDTYRSQIISSFALLALLLLIISRLIIQKRTLYQAKDELLLAKQKYRTVADHTYDWEYWQTPDYVLQYVSPSCKRICDYTAEELIKNPALLRIIILPEDQWIWDKHTCGDHNTEKNKIINFRILRPDGEVRWIEHVCQPVFDYQGNYQGKRASNRDITEREFYKTQTHQLQSDLAHMDRLVSLNTLTSAVAHEINQPLAAMRSYAQAAIRFLNADTPDYENISKALNGIVEDNKRAATVVNRLRGLVKKGEVQKELVEVNSAINGVLSLLASEIILKNISINYNPQPQALVVFFDLIQLQQVIINLLTNAFDAIESLPANERTITISAALENENSAIVTISDSGNGIRPELMGTIFDPFQTTKPKGIGIGLSICKSILEAHDGKILVDNTKNGGAVFSLILPIAGEPRKIIS